MNCKLTRLFYMAVVLPPLAAGTLPQLARAALDTPNTLFGIDGMVLNAGGLFRDPSSFGTANGNDGFNSFQFGSFTINAPVTFG